VTAESVLPIRARCWRDWNSRNRKPGALTIPRAEGKRLVRHAGGTAEDRVSHQTDIVVVGGQSPHWKAEKKGQKLLDVDYERGLGMPSRSLRSGGF